MNSLSYSLWASHDETQAREWLLPKVQAFVRELIRKQVAKLNDTP